MQDIYQTPIYKITLEPGKNQSIKITAIDKSTLEIFESDFIILQKINVGAISAAFNSQCHQIKHWISRQGDVVQLEIKIEMDFIMPVSEVIMLLRIKQNAEYKYLINQLKKELTSLQADLNKIGTQTYKMHQIGYYTSKQGGNIFVSDTIQGQFLIQISGLIALNYDGNGDYYYGCEFEGQRPISFDLEAKVYQGNQQENKIVQAKVYRIFGSTQDGYQTPFKISFITTLKKAGKMVIIQKGPLNNCISLTQILLTISQVQ